MNTTTSLAYRRKRIGKTDYRKRLLLLKAGCPRFVVRRQSRGIIAQLIEYHPDGDKILVSATIRDLTRAGWNVATSNVPASYLLGYILGRKAVAKKIPRAVFDIGPHTLTKGSRIFACLKGVLDAGVDIPHGEDVVPSADRLFGKHIDTYRKTNIQKLVTDVKAKIV